MKSTTHLLTNDGKRIAKRLVNHWKHKFEVQETEQDFKILMPTACPFNRAVKRCY